MSVFFNGKKAARLFIGGQELNKAYHNGELIFQKSGPTPTTPLLRVYKTDNTYHDSNSLTDLDNFLTFINTQATVSTDFTFQDSTVIAHGDIADFYVREIDFNRLNTPTAINIAVDKCPNMVFTNSLNGVKQKLVYNISATAPQTTITIKTASYTGTHGTIDLDEIDITAAQAISVEIGQTRSQRTYEGVKVGKVKLNLSNVSSNIGGSIFAGEVSSNNISGSLTIRTNKFIADGNSFTVAFIPLTYYGGSSANLEIFSKNGNALTISEIRRADSGDPTGITSSKLKTNCDIVFSGTAFGKRFMSYEIGGAVSYSGSGTFEPLVGYSTNTAGASVTLTEHYDATTDALQLTVGNNTVNLSTLVAYDAQGTSPVATAALQYIFKSSYTFASGYTQAYADIDPQITLTYTHSAVQGTDKVTMGTFDKDYRKGV